jgi:hypothetical protein
MVRTAVDPAPTQADGHRSASVLSSSQKGVRLTSLLLENADLIAVFYYLLTAVSILLGVLSILNNSRQESARRLRETYQSVSSAYVNLLERSLEHPEVPLLDEHLMLKYFDISPDHPEIGLFRKRWIFYSLIVNCFENAYLAFNAGSSRAHQRQWAGWEEWISDSLGTPELRRMWEDFKNAFDVKFAEQVDEVLAKRSDGARI